MIKLPLTLILTLGLGCTLYAEQVFNDPLSDSIQISAAGMRAQNERLKVITQNIANENITALTEKDDPYRRKVIYFENKFDKDLNTETLAVKKIDKDYSPFKLRYEPTHPAADKDGMVKYPNINLVIETVDAKEAQRSFEANLYALDISKSNLNKIIDLMK